MNALHVTVEAYERPLRSPLVVGGHTLYTRQGLIVTVTDEQGRSGQGEIAPLPGLHAEGLEAAQADVTRLGAAARRFIVTRSDVTMPTPINRQTGAAR